MSIKIQDVLKAVDENVSKGKFTILEEQKGWVRVQTQRTGKIWTSPLMQLREKITKMHEDGSFDADFAKTDGNPFKES